MLGKRTQIQLLRAARLLCCDARCQHAKRVLHECVELAIARLFAFAARRDGEAAAGEHNSVAKEPEQFRHLVRRGPRVEVLLQRCARYLRDARRHCARVRHAARTRRALARSLRSSGEGVLEGVPPAPAAAAAPLAGAPLMGSAPLRPNRLCSEGSRAKVYPPPKSTGNDETLMLATSRAPLVRIVRCAATRRRKQTRAKRAEPRSKVFEFLLDSSPCACHDSRSVLRSAWRWR